ncbi:glycoside hydrolase family 76 protein [Annulohypoxylon maeteangense]|uniref:glycoside hydrolase family 76 protein n=1 Tax=Annulohypoxylon maeteangense TaxID=1927788 RepID=UPI002007B9EF|nr:glycoside hydrolase family 76 protein [Annulohypoxylon maeteangense]KAI0883695.1 glycoside hydrolase family 76 protein [Annulohypoxylon maeteangense]
MTSSLVATYDLDAQSTDSIKDVAKQMAQDLASFYNGNEPGQTPGLLPQPYYWWEAGALMGTFVDYWYYTGDTTYNDIASQGLLHQVGPYNDYMPPNQTLTEGNDDQGFWGMAVMSAAEYKFPNPPSGQPGWLALAQAVFNTQAARWDPDHCNGGLRWQIFTWNNGFDYKNSISQACFFNIAARLALYTGNSTYADWATKTWDWMVNVKFIDSNYRIYDGGHIEDNCTTITPYEFSYNVGAFLLGTAAMVEYSNTTSKKSGDVEMWSERVDGILNSTEQIFFFGNDTADRIMIEIACEPVNLCDTDELSFKAYLSRWMAATTKWAPWTFDRIKTLLSNSAVAAAKQCTGGDNHRMCGLKWANNSGQWDGTTGVGQQMAALEVVLANMIQQAEAPVTNGTGGTSAGNPSAGGSDDGRVDPSGRLYGPTTSGDRAGAAICTVVILFGLLSGVVFMVTDETKSVADNWASARSTVSGTSGLALLAVGKKPTNEEKGKGVAMDRSSSTDTGEKILAVYTGSKLQKRSDSVQEPNRQSLNRNRLSAPPGAFSPTADATTAPNRRSSTNTIARRASVLRKQQQ